MALPDRRPYRRETEEARRDALISAALELVAEGGAKAATVRAIAERAGVTPGLIRHYFASKDELTREAYRTLMHRMTQKSMDAVDADVACPLRRLGQYIGVSLRPPVMDPAGVGLWAGFLHGMRSDDAMRAVHKQNYFEYRDMLQTLIAALPRDASPARLRADAIACNGVIDGLWLEGSVLPEGFEPGELERIGLEAVGAILGVDLAGALAPGAGGTDETENNGDTA